MAGALELAQMLADMEACENAAEFCELYPTLSIWFFWPRRRGTLAERDMSSCFCCSAMRVRAHEIMSGIKSDEESGSRGFPHRAPGRLTGFLANTSKAK